MLAALVLKELIDNALDAGAAASLCHDPEANAWIVSDDGPGIDPDKVAELFAVNRPLRSSKLKRMPTRGMLGNGLRVVMGWARRLSVETQGCRLVLEVDETTGKTIVTEREDVEPLPGLRVTLACEDSSDGERLAELTLALAGVGPCYSGPSSPWWYGPADFAKLFRNAPASTTAADIIRDLGLDPPPSLDAKLASEIDPALLLRTLRRGLRQLREGRQAGGLRRRLPSDRQSQPHRSGTVRLARG